MGQIEIVAGTYPVLQNDSRVKTDVGPQGPVIQEGTVPTATGVGIAVFYCIVFVFFDNVVIAVYEIESSGFVETG